MGAPNINKITLRYQPEVSLLVQSLVLNAIDLMIEVPPQKITEIANTGKFSILPRPWQKQSHIPISPSPNKHNRTHITLREKLVIEN